MAELTVGLIASTLFLLKILILNDYIKFETIERGWHILRNTINKIKGII